MTLQIKINFKNDRMQLTLLPYTHDTTKWIQTQASKRLKIAWFRCANSVSFNSSLDATGCVALGSKFYLDHVGRIDDTLAVSLMSVAQGIEIVVWTMDEGEVEESL